MQRKRKYTEAVHAKRVQKVIEKEKPSKHCPAQPRYKINSPNPFAAWKGVVCRICKDFIGIEYDCGCPCARLGLTEAIRRTRQALKEKGYLDNSVF
ncbi:hypothetical protein LCGC14_1810120 [marine sediment metagenome]|uniref:Uncharacterized protein n=1 Tax=marine sediment metagenome TaxID=412755 RepID=A0A0F9GLW1_9ZZZZ